jgi:hypothetical protein
MKTQSLIAAILTAAALAGCGSSSSSSSSGSSTAASSSAATTSAGGTTAVPAAFKSGFAADKAQFSRLGTDLGHAIAQAPTRTNAQIATEFASLSARTSQQASQLRQLQAPPSFQPEITQLAAGFDKVAADMRAIVSIATSGNGKQARPAGATLALDSAKVKAIDRDVTAKLGLPQTP